MSSNSKLSMNGFIALVTGGGTGIGRMIAEGFADNGAKVYVTGRRVEPLENTSKEYQGPGSIVALPMDVTDAASIAQGVKLVSEVDGRLNVLVNNAGISSTFQDDNEMVSARAALLASNKPCLSLETPEGFDAVFKLNTSAPFFMSIAFQDLLTEGAKHLAREGRSETSSIINISSIASHTKSVVAVASFSYSLSKAALDLLTTQLATSYARYNIPIRVNTLAPGVFATEIISPEIFDGLRENPLPGFTQPIPLKRLGKKSEMADTAVYLATNGYVNGVYLGVSGGVDLVNV